MATNLKALTEKEKETLRLIVRGHDAKSTARELGLSVHTINERLRDARRKLEVSSSREAARLLLVRESATLENIGDKPFGDDVATNGGATAAVQAASVSHDGKGAGLRTSWLIAGVALMSLFLALFFLAAAQPQALGASPATASAPVAESASTAVARHFLELGDAARWEDAYAVNGASFHRLNTLAAWTAAAQKVRGPLGAVTSRTLMSEEAVPAPPAGVQVVKYRTRFASGREAVETVSLDNEAGAWKVVGVYVD